jgi:CubicO group peptidase (beta-lactamase class C family)
VKFGKVAPILFASIVLSASPSFAQPNSATDADMQLRLQRIDAMVNDRMQALNMVGYSLTIIKSGKVVFQKSYGFQNLETRQPATNDTIFGLGSLTKTFTAITLLSLVDKGLVGLDDPLSKYIDGLTPEYKSLTIRQLASMTAGVPSKISQEVAWRDQLDILDHTPLVSQPGSAYLYSNYSYRLLGTVIEKVTKQPYLKVVESTICAPLNMRSTGSTTLLQPTGRLAQAYGDNMGKGPLRSIEYKNPAIQFSAGMLGSTSNDLINYVLGLLNRQILSPEAYKVLWDYRPPLTTGQPSKWAFGWAKGNNPQLNGQLTLMMNGGVPGVASSIMILPESNSAVIAMSNLRKLPVYQIAKIAAAMAFGNAGEQPAQSGSGEEEDHPGASSD